MKERKRCTNERTHARTNEREEDKVRARTRRTMFAAGSAKRASPRVDVIFPRLEKKNQPSAEAPSARM